MPRNEDGEFELILGNRQLLSVFFIVVILLGVFFTMGYIVGRNSSPLLASDAGLKVDKSGDAALRPNAAGSAVAPPAANTPASASESPKDSPQTPALAPAETAVVKTEAPKAQEKAPQSASPTPDQPASGETYLQVVAVEKAEAQLFVDVLAKKGFHALYVQVPDKPQTFRVLVGPFKDAGAISQARTDLQKAGFKGFEALVRKY